MVEMPQRGNMKKLAEERFGESLEALIPRLMREYKTPHRVGVHIGVYANSVRTWLLDNGWAFHNGQWTKQEKVGHD